MNNQHSWDSSRDRMIGRGLRFALILGLALVLAGTHAEAQRTEPPKRIGVLLFGSSANGKFVDQGALMSCGPNLADMWGSATVHVEKIFKGARPGELPAEQPTTFELVINLRTAKALGITIPQSLLLRADRAIE